MRFLGTFIKLLFILFIPGVFGSRGSSTKLERMNRARFFLKAKKGEHRFTSPEGQEVRQWSSAPKYFVEERKDKNSQLQTYKEFDYKTGRLITHGQQFHGFSVGIWRFYDTKGKLTQEIDKDKRYAFSVEALTQRMKDLGVDLIIEQTGVTVMRTDVGEPYYSVTHDELKLKIDGTTGEILGTERVGLRK